MGWAAHIPTLTPCPYPSGDGWSPRAEDAVLHGCVPVVIMDGVHAVFESILDWGSFSLRVPESQLEQLPELLLAVTPERLQAMQAALARVWHRWGSAAAPLHPAPCPAPALGGAGEQVVASRLPCIWRTSGSRFTYFSTGSPTSLTLRSGGSSRWRPT
jgi:hypothetical protein